MASKVYEFSVEMTCEGCSNAVKNVCSKKEGIDGLEIDLQRKRIYVTSTLSADEVLQTVKQTGKTTEYIGEKK